MRRAAEAASADSPRFEEIHLDTQTDTFLVHLPPTLHINNVCHSLTNKVSFSTSRTREAFRVLTCALKIKHF